MAAFERGDPINRRVQGTRASISDLVLQNGRKVVVDIGGAIVPTPTLKRGMGNSSIEFTIHDSKLKWLSLGLSKQKFDAKIDGLWFRYLGTSKQGKQLTLRFEDRDVARLRELKGPKKVVANRGKSNETTRAEFILSLVNELRPKLKIAIPELHEKQPIASREQGEEAKQRAREDRGKGIGDQRDLTIKGERAESEQRNIVDRSLRVAEHRSAPFRVQVALVAALIQESLCRNLTGGHGTSQGVLQVIDTTAAEGGFNPRDVEASVDGFLTGYIDNQGGAIAYYKANPGASAAEIAAAVQRNRDGASSYSPHESEAREWVEAFDGAGGGRTETVTEPFTFEVRAKNDKGKPESYWEAIQRLARDVNWRAFIVAGRFFYISEPELSRGQVRLSIGLDDEGNPTPAGVESVDFDYNANKPVTQATVTAFVRNWSPPPGSVVTLRGYGPASLGFGDPPPKKKRPIGLSSNREARTGEGRGRYLVTNIEVPVEGDLETRLATITLRKPTAPLPEPRNETRTRDIRSSGRTGDDAVSRMIDEADRIDGLKSPYLYGGGHGSSTSAGGPWDCSGAVSRLLDVAGILPNGAPVVSGRLAEMYQPGPGEEVTIYANEGHVWIRLRGRDWGTSRSNPHGGPGWHENRSTAGFTARHPEGM